MRLVVDSKIPFAWEAFGTLGEVDVHDAKEIDKRSVNDADVLIVRSETRVDEELLAGSRVRFVGTATIGTDHVNEEFLAEHGIGFASAPGSNANSVAEYVVAVLLVLAERLGITLRGRTLGVVGVGNIGSKVVRYATALGMSVLQNDPPLARQTGHAVFIPLDSLMDADIITLHVPLTQSGEDRTFHFFDNQRISNMKKGSILINTSRGGVADTNALKEALARGHLQTAVLDVWEHEPDIDADLVGLTTIATPHISGYSFDGKVNGTRMMYEAVCRHFGLPRTWDPSVKLTKAIGPRIRLSEESGEIEGLVHQIVRTCYDIERDDSNLRHLLSCAVEERSRYFQKLRREYPERREFFNTTVVLSPRKGELSKILGVLGFQVEIEDRTSSARMNMGEDMT